MLLRALAFATTLLILGLTPTFADTISPEYIPRGSDVSNLRCPDGIVSTGDLIRNVDDKCGVPLREADLEGRRYYVRIYRFDQSRNLYYLAFLHERLQRIYHVTCRSDNPDCD